VHGYGALVAGATIPPVIVEFISGANGAGEGLLTATGVDELTWTPPGGVAGVAVAVADGESVLLEGDNPNKFIIVTRDGVQGLAGVMPVVCLLKRNNMIGMGDLTEPAVGDADRYRAGMLYNGSGIDDTNIKIKVDTLGAANISNGGQVLPVSGAGTIATNGTFFTWDDSGWCRVETNAGALRENVYYTSRTDGVLTVPAVGRSMLGTTAAVGASDDVIYPIPGIRIGLEAPVDGAIQTITDENTAPSTITWSSEITFAAGLSIATLADTGEYGLWIHHEIPFNVSMEMSGAPSIENSISTQWVNDGVTYAEAYPGLYAADQFSQDTFLVFVGVDAAPDPTATPDAEGASFPLTAGITPPGAGEEELNTLALDRNAWNMTSRNLRTHSLKINSAGEETTSPLAVPLNVSAVVAPGGNVNVLADYAERQSVDAADAWNVYIRTDGTDPVPGADTPVQVPIGFGRSLTPNGYLAELFGPYNYQTDFRVVVTVERSSDGAESTNTTVTQALVDTYPPLMVKRRRGFAGEAYGRTYAPDFFSFTEIIDIPTQTRLVVTEGKILFYMGSVLVFGLVVGGDDPDNYSRVYIPKDNFEFEEVAVSGTGGTLPVEVVDVNTAYIVVNGQRRAKIDVTAGRIQASPFQYKLPTLRESLFDGPLWQCGDMVVFQAWDAFMEEWVSVLTVDANGVFATGVFVDASKIQTTIEDL
jgi:hypothetical protein